MLRGTANKIRKTDIFIEAKNSGFPAMKEYDSNVKSTGQKLTCPVDTALLELKEIANRFTIGNKQVSAIKVTNI